MDTKGIAMRIRERMTALRLSQREVALRAGVSPTRVNELANERLGDKVALHTLAKIAEVLGVRLTYLIDGDTDAGSELQIARLQMSINDIRDLLLTRLPAPDVRSAAAGLKLIDGPVAPSVPIYGSAAAGYGARNEPVEAWHDVPHLSIPSALAALPGKLFALRVKGVSMEPLLAEGALIVVHNADNGITRPPGGSGLQLITSVDFDEYVKLAVWDDRRKRVLLRSLNPDYPEQALKYSRLKYSANVVMIVAADTA